MNWSFRVNSFYYLFIIFFLYSCDALFLEKEVSVSKGGSVDSNVKKITFSIIDTDDIDLTIVTEEGDSWDI